jgi:hypothetical protein
MKCPYCGNDEPDKFIFGDSDDDPYVTCLACNGEFEPEEMEYYEKRSKEGESEEDKLISLSALIQVLNKEIEWSRDNQGQTESNLAWAFVKGLEQAKYLITEIPKVDYQEGKMATLLIINDSKFDTEAIHAFPQQVRDQLDSAQTPDQKDAGIWVVLLGDNALAECEFILSRRGIRYYLAHPGEAEIMAHPENLPRPGYMGDYGGIPHGPFDI